MTATATKATPIEDMTDDELTAVIDKNRAQAAELQRQHGAIPSGIEAAILQGDHERVAQLQRGIRDIPVTVNGLETRLVSLRVEQKTRRVSGREADFTAASEAYAEWEQRNAVMQAEGNVLEGRRHSARMACREAQSDLAAEKHRRGDMQNLAAKATHAAISRAQAGWQPLG